MLKNNRGIQDLKEDGFTQKQVNQLVKDVKQELPKTIVSVMAKLMVVKGISCKSWAVKEIIKELWENDTTLELQKTLGVDSNVEFFIDPYQKENVRALTSY